MNGLYLHIPFCLKKCNYCDFSSFPKLMPRADEYIEGLCREMKLYSGEGVDTVYFGGGTPSILSDVQLGRILESVFNNFKVSSNAEITIEVNPCTADFNKAKSLYSMGFNRISFGVQSAIETELKILGRLHSFDDATKTYDDFRRAGFSNISLDLMYALPGQSIQSLNTSIERMINLSPEHISCYGLKIEEGTPFYSMLSKGEITEKSDDEYADMYEFICKILEDKGYSQYELSNFSKDGYESKHNLKYWTLKDYIGLGLSAASCYRNKRYTRTSDFNSYLENFENDEISELTREDKMAEYMILSLRLTKIGANKARFKELFGKEIEEVFSDPVKKHLDQGLLIDMGDRYCLSKKAYYISNTVLCDFI